MHECKQTACLPSKSQHLDFQIHRMKHKGIHTFKHARHYENTPIQIYWNFLLPNYEFFQIKRSDSFHISAQNLDCGYSLKPPRRGGSNEYPQSMFLSRNKKIMYTPVGFKGVKII